MGVAERYANGPSFFESNPDSQGAVLSAQQIDVAQPNVVGLDTVTDPLIPSRYLASRLPNFDPEIYDLRDASHLMRLLRALMGAAGVGGYQRQIQINRFGAALAGTHFLDLDGFWGALFGTARLAAEQLPDGLDPATTAADSATWDAAHSADAAYRNRIYQVAKGFSHGGTLTGLQIAAEALLDCEVDILESWVLADTLSVAAAQGTAFGNTWNQVVSQRPKWSDVNDTWDALEGGQTQLSVITRSEIVLSPQRPITDDERQQALDVLELLKPAGTVITVQGGDGTSLRQVEARSYWADSEDWDVISTVTPNSSIVGPDGTVYASATGTESARPAFGRFTGEQWSYNSRIATVSAYAEDGGVAQDGLDYQSVVFSDGTAQDYKPSEALLDQRVTAYARLAAEGVQTTYPYSTERQ